MAVLDFNVNTPAEHANVESMDGDPDIKPLLRQISNTTRKDLLMLQASRGFLVCGSLAREGSFGEALPEASSHSLAPFSMPAPAAVPSRTAARSELPLTRGRTASLPPRGGTRNSTASLAAL